MPVSLFRPWRSVWLPRIITAVALLAGLPLYLRMPLWCDLTLYDLAARNVLEGGVHYRDVFDTNLPGFVWILAGIRWVFGFGASTLRCVDLAVVTGIVILIDHLAKRGGATPATRWWALAGAALLYPFAVEMAHCQRDTWMALPVLGAVVLRLRHIEKPANSPFWTAALEGVLWAVGVWIKPHVVLIAAGVWLMTARRVAAVNPRRWAGFAADLLGNLAGGLAVGLAGIAYLHASGTWPYFMVVMTDWAPAYAEIGSIEREGRLSQELHWYPVWSLWLPPTLILAFFSFIDAVPWRGRLDPSDTHPGPIGRLFPAWLWDREADAHARFTRGTLAVLWFVWAFQAFYIQRGFMYVHMTETLLMLGLWASHRWAMPFIAIAWLAGTSVLWLIGDVNSDLRTTLKPFAEHEALADWDDPAMLHHLVRHPLADPNRMSLWADCWRCNLSERERFVLWDKLKRIQDHEASPGWEELAEVADFLRSQGVQDYEVIAWHDSPHVLYLTMGLKPGVRFMHLNTAMMIGPNARPTVFDELFQRGRPKDGRPAARYAVSDLGWAALGQPPDVKAMMLAPPAGLTHVPFLCVYGFTLTAYWYDLYPPKLKNWHRATFPFNQPPIFRSRGGLGRYIVHELQPELGDLPTPPNPEGP